MAIHVSEQFNIESFNKDAAQGIQGRPIDVRYEVQTYSDLQKVDFAYPGLQVIVLDEFPSITNTSLVNATSRTINGEHSVYECIGVKDGHPTWSLKIPTRHSSIEKSYGVGNDVVYGHVKLSDTVTNVSDVADLTAAVGATAATPYAIATLHEALQRESDDRKAADKTLQTNIDNEAAAREEADKSLDTRLTTAEGTLTEHTTRLGACEQNIENMQTTIDSFKNEDLKKITETLEEHANKLNTLDEQVKEVKDLLQKAEEGGLVPSGLKDYMYFVGTYDCTSISLLDFLNQQLNADAWSKGMTIAASSSGTIYKCSDISISEGDIIIALQGAPANVNEVFASADSFKQYFQVLAHSIGSSIDDIYYPAAPLQYWIKNNNTDTVTFIFDPVNLNGVWKNNETAGTTKTLTLTLQNAFNKFIDISTASCTINVDAKQTADSITTSTDLTQSSEHILNCCSIQWESSTTLLNSYQHSYYLTAQFDMQQKTVVFNVKELEQTAYDTPVLQNPYEVLLGQLAVTIGSTKEGSHCYLTFYPTSYMRPAVSGASAISYPNGNVLKY